MMQQIRAFPYGKARLPSCHLPSVVFVCEEKLAIKIELQKKQKPEILRADRKMLDAIYAENDVPQPQPPVAFGFSKVKPEPIIFDV